MVGQKTNYIMRQFHLLNKMFTNLIFKKLYTILMGKVNMTLKLNQAVKKLGTSLFI